MFGATVTEDIPLNAETWGWGYNCQLSFDNGVMDCLTTAEWAAAATGWNNPNRDLSEWDKIVIEVAYTSGCDGEHFKLKAYLRDFVNKDVEEGQLETTISQYDDDSPKTMVINLKEEGKNVNLTACGVLAIQSQPNGSHFKISRVYLEKEVPAEYYLVGNFNNWQADEAYKFAVNEGGAEGEYMLLGVDLAKEDSLKVIGISGETTTWYPDNAPNYGIAKDGIYNIYFRPDGQGADDWYYHSFYVGEVVDETVIYVAFPAENRPTYISVAGTFAAGQWGMREFGEPWYTCDEDLYTGKGDVLKFRDSNNENYVLCKKSGDKWFQVLLYCKDYEVVSWKGEMYRVIEELDYSDPNMYAWKEGMPEPDPEEQTEGVANTAANVKAVKVIRNGQVLILKNGKTFNALGAEVK